MPKDAAVQYVDTELPRWTVDPDVSAIRRTFEFADFVSSFRFMTGVTLEAEKMNHHPEWTNVYNEGLVSLNTHDAGGVTNNDLELARKIDRLYAEEERC